MDTAQLWTRCRAGDASARAALIERYLPLARALARRIRLINSPLVDDDDVASAAVLGLIDAVDRYEPGRGVPFEAYASLRIRGAMIDELRRTGARSRTSAAEQPRVLSLDGLVEDDWTAFLATDDGTDARHDADDLRGRVEGALGSLPPRQREVLARYYAGSMTLREAGLSMGISEARACQLHGRAIYNLRRALSVRVPAVHTRTATAA